MLEHQPAEVGEVRQVPLASEELPAQFFLQLPDPAAKRGYADAALLGSAREIERLPRFEEVAYLMHFHDKPPDRPKTGPAGILAHRWACRQRGRTPGLQGGLRGARGVSRSMREVGGARSRANPS